MELFYFVDPMCSWCYGFSPEFKKVIEKLPDDIQLHYVMGGLAPDSSEPMADEMKAYIQHHWHTVADKTGAAFNFDFWTKCEAKRSTYPSCRAVITAGLQREDNIPLMLEAIQKAYYQQARNPTDNETLIEIAGELGLDQERFAEDLESPKVNDLMQTGFNFKHSLGIQGFPTLVLQKADKYYALTIGYTQAEVILERINTVINDRMAA